MTHSLLTTENPAFKTPPLPREITEGILTYVYLSSMTIRLQRSNEYLKRWFPHDAFNPELIRLRDKADTAWDSLQKMSLYGGFSYGMLSERVTHEMEKALGGKEAMRPGTTHWTETWFPDAKPR